MTLSVAQGIQALVDATIAVDAAEEAWKAAKKIKRDLETVTLPEVFADAGTVESTLPSGAKAKLGTMIEGSLPRVDEKSPTSEQLLQEEARAAAIRWLCDNDCEDLIKSEVRASYAKGDAEQARKLAAEIRRTSNSAVVKLIEDIHPQTLQAEARRRLGAGTAIPLATLGLVALPAVKLTKKPKEQ